MILKKMQARYEDISLMGRILKVQTYVYSTVWNNAWLINTKGEDFRQFLVNVGKYLSKFKSKQTLEKVQKRIEEGGLNLINITERIETIKAKEMLESGTGIPETDNIVYGLGTKQKKLLGKLFTGPKSENINEECKEIVSQVESKIETIKNYKKRHKDTRTKQLQDILFSKEKMYYFKGIFTTKDPRLISMNYQMLHGLLPLFGNNLCNFCKREKETLEHILFKCTFLENIRREAKEWLEIISNRKFDDRWIIEMIDVENIVENQLISLYKSVLWKYRNVYFNKTPNEKIIKDKLESELRFYIHFKYHQGKDT